MGEPHLPTPDSPLPESQTALGNQWEPHGGFRATGCKEGESPRRALVWGRGHCPRYPITVTLRQPRLFVSLLVYWIYDPPFPGSCEGVCGQFILQKRVGVDNSPFCLCTIFRSNWGYCHCLLTFKIHWQIWKHRPLAILTTTQYKRLYFCLSNNKYLTPIHKGSGKACQSLPHKGQKDKEQIAPCPTSPFT